VLQRYSEALRKHESKLVLAGGARRWRWTIGLTSDALIELVGRLQLGLRASFEFERPVLSADRYGWSRPNAPIDQPRPNGRYPRQCCRWEREARRQQRVDAVQKRAIAVRLREYHKTPPDLKQIAYSAICAGVAADTAFRAMCLNSRGRLRPSIAEPTSLDVTHGPSSPRRNVEPSGRDASPARIPAVNRPAGSTRTP